MVLTMAGKHTGSQGMLYGNLAHEGHELVMLELVT